MGRAGESFGVLSLNPRKLDARVKPAHDDQVSVADPLYRLENANCQIGSGPNLVAFGVVLLGFSAPAPGLPCLQQASPAISWCSASSNMRDFSPPTSTRCLRPASSSTSCCRS